MRVNINFIKIPNQVVMKNEIVRYGALIGSRNYLIIITRLDILFVISHILQFLINLIKKHFEAVKRIYIYLADIKEFGLTYYNKGFGLIGYVNVD
jgi:hypothetical protein